MMTGPDIFLGNWRIVGTELWSRRDLDMVQPAYLRFERGGHGEMAFIALHASLQWGYGALDGKPWVEFDWYGSDEGTEVAGEGDAILDQDALHGTILFDNGDETAFIAKRTTSSAAC